VDPGISGLSLNARPALRSLLSDVLAGRRGYDAILVYDVSRWGRFQDLDQGAHYEFVCREAGVDVIYTAEPFAQDGSFASAIMKHLKRVMAAEYSRELSAKVRRAQRGLQAQGYWVGGSPGYGLRRMSVGPSGEMGMLMEQGQRKALQGYRVVLVPGPDNEVRMVRRIYSLFLVGGMRMPTIAGVLNDEGIPAERGAAWTRQRVRSVLTNEKYTGVIIGGKHAGPLGAIRRLRPQSEWVRAEGRLAPLIPRARFDLVQAQLPTPRRSQPTDEQLLEELRVAWAAAGYLSTSVIDQRPETRSAVTYKRRFGNLEAAYERVGYAPSARQRAASRNARTRDNGRFKPRPDPIDPDWGWAQLEAHYRRLGRVSGNTIEVDPALPSVGWYRATFGGLETIYQRLGYEPSRRQRFHIELQRTGPRNYRRPL
jgi:hypothetical protein